MTSNQIAFEQVDPETNTVRVFRTDAALQYTPGDVVETPRGVGVVNATMTDTFDFPTEGDDEVAVQATPESPAYIVGFGGRSAPYRGSHLNEGDLYNPRQNGEPTKALVDPIAEHGFHREAMRENWGRRDLLQWWSNGGGLWRTNKQYLERERDVTDEEARSIVSKRKDMVLGTDRWRTRF